MAIIGERGGEGQGEGGWNNCGRVSRQCHRHGGTKNGKRSGESTARSLKLKNGVKILFFKIKMLRVRLLRSRFIFLPNYISIPRQNSHEKAPKILQFYYLQGVECNLGLLEYETEPPPPLLFWGRPKSAKFPSLPPTFLGGEKTQKVASSIVAPLFQGFVWGGGGRLLSGGVKGGLLPIQREERVCIDIHKKIPNRCRKNKTLSLPFNELLPDTVIKSAKVSESKLWKREN